MEYYTAIKNDEYSDVNLSLLPVLPFHGLLKARSLLCIETLQRCDGDGAAGPRHLKNYSIYLIVIMIDSFECLL